jgi:hypothetical protein
MLWVVDVKMLWLGTTGVPCMKPWKSTLRPQGEQLNREAAGKVTEQL